jgi:hypothetical protein
MIRKQKRSIEHTDRQKDRKTERQRERETERQRDRETERLRDRKTERHKDRKTERQKDRKTEILKDRKIRKKTKNLIVSMECSCMTYRKSKIIFLRQNCIKELFLPVFLSAFPSFLCLFVVRLSI